MYVGRNASSVKTMINTKHKHYLSNSECFVLVLWLAPHIQGGPELVDRPTQLICICIIYLYYICHQTNTKDIAGQSASPEYAIASPATATP